MGAGIGERGYFMRWSWKAAAAALVAGTVLIVGSKWSGGKRLQPENKTIQVKRGDLKVTILATGVVQPQNRLEIKPPISGRVEEVLVQEGHSVTKGQVLVWMSSTDRAALLDAARAKGEESLSRWEEIYKPAPLIAPLDGTIIRRSVEPGQTVTAQDGVFVLSDRLIIQAQVDETDIGQIKLRQEAIVTLDAYPGEEVQATVDHIAYEAKTVNNVTIYEVDILPNRVPEFMRSGMTSNVTFVVAVKSGVLVLPLEAVRREEGQMTVLVPGSMGGKPFAKTVKIGASDGKTVEILSGLNEGERVLMKTLRGDISQHKQLLSPFAPGPRRRST